MAFSTIVVTPAIRTSMNMLSFSGSQEQTRLATQDCRILLCFAFSIFHSSDSTKTEMGRNGTV